MKISFLTWTNNSDQYENFMKSVKKSCTDYEFIAVGQSCKSMAEAYNWLTKKAIGDILVYVHQDIIIRDTKFQEILESIFIPGNNIGFAGVVGSKIMTNAAWWDTTRDNYLGKIIQGDKLEIIGDSSGYAGNLDACIMCTDKRFEFPEELPGIHFLDAWICRKSINMGYKNYVFDSYIQHLSQGNMDESYYKNMEIYQKHFNLI